MSITKKLGLLSAATVLAPATALASEGAASGDSSKGLIALGAGIAIGLGAFGGTTSQSKAASAALEGISRNPGAADKIQTPMILGLALIESLVLLAFVVAFLLQGKITLG